MNVEVKIPDPYKCKAIFCQNTPNRPKQMQKPRDPNQGYPNPKIKAPKILRQSKLASNVIYLRFRSKILFLIVNAPKQ